MMRKMIKFCCEGVDIMMEPETKDKITVPADQSCHKAKDATVIPAKRKCVKNMVCNCFLHCICGKCNNTKTKTKTISTNFNRRNYFSSPPRPIYAAADYGNEAKGSIYKWQTK